MRQQRRYLRKGGKHSYSTAVAWSDWNNCPGSNGEDTNEYVDDNEGTEWSGRGNDVDVDVDIDVQERNAQEEERNNLIGLILPVPET